MQDSNPSATDVENGTQSMPRDGCRSADGSSAPALDKGARALVQLLAWALVVGAVVVAAQPAYRAAFLSLLRGGGDDASPLWRSNANYYQE